MVNRLLLLVMIVWGSPVMTELDAQSDTIPLIKMNSGHLSVDVRLQNVIDAKAMLESGIPFPILDSMFVVQNQKKLNVQLVPSEISMNLNGRKMRCYYQTTDTISVNSQIHTGITLIGNLASRGIDMMYPIQSFINPADSGSCIVELDIQNLFMRHITNKELAGIKNKYRELDIKKDELGNMYSLDTELSVRDTMGRNTILNATFIPDLGNVMFLALFESHPDVKSFIHNTNIQLQKGYNSKGQPLPVKVMSVYECTFGKEEKFSNVTFITTPFYTQLKSDGFLGLDFLRRFNVILDFQHNKFYLKRIHKEN